MGSARRSLAVLGLFLLVAPSALGHGANLTFTFIEGPDCPQGKLSCIQVTGEAGTEGNIPDDFGRVLFVGKHPVTIEVRNEGNVPHNLTFEPNSDLADYTMDEPIDPGQSQTLETFITTENVSAGKYKFYGGQAGHRDAGEKGVFTIEPAPQPQAEENDSSDLVNEIVGVPAVGPSLALATLAAAALSLRAREP